MDFTGFLFVLFFWYLFINLLQLNQLMWTDLISRLNPSSLLILFYSDHISLLLIISFDYIVSMSASAHKNRDTVGDNQTLFDFLRRKKKINLENTVNKTLTQLSHSKKKYDLEGDVYDYQKDQATKASIYYQSNNQARRGTRDTITPKKIEFDDNKANKHSLKQASQTQQQSNQGKSFLSMISPLKNRTSHVQDDYYDKENIPRSNKKVPKASESFSKKNVTKSINSIKQAMNFLSDSLRSLKQKSHGLVLQFNPLFNQISDTNSALSKQIGDFRNKIKGFQALIDAANVQNVDEIIESFHKNLEEHLQFEQASIKKSLEKAKQEELAHIRSQKDRLIERLQSENKKMSKQIDILLRRLQKAENHHQSLEEAATERQVTTVEQIQRLKLAYESNIQQLKQRNQDLSQKSQALTEKCIYLEKQLKNERFSKESYEEKRRQEIQAIIQAKDAYLLNEIMVLKAEFSADLNRINELHKIKQAELMGRIEKKGQEVSKLAFERGCDKQIESKILEEANQVKQENSQLKAKVDCIITDMYRMNQQLYQHWMALKDIKALSNRLGSFAQYRKIYDDLLFNDHLFH